MQRCLLVLVALCAAVIGVMLLQQHTVRGIVTSAAGPVACATVHLRASLASTPTDATGRFTLTCRGPVLHQIVTAWREGFYPAGTDLSAQQGGCIARSRWAS